jgi:hypothetical protein
MTSWLIMRMQPEETLFPLIGQWLSEQSTAAFGEQRPRNGPLKLSQLLDFLSLSPTYHSKPLGLSTIKAACCTATITPTKNSRLPPLHWLHVQHRNDHRGNDPDLSISPGEASIPIDWRAVNRVNVGRLSAFVLLAALVSGLLSFKHRWIGSILTALLFAAPDVFRTYYPRGLLLTPATPPGCADAPASRPGKQPKGPRQHDRQRARMLQQSIQRLPLR